MDKTLWERMHDLGGFGLACALGGLWVIGTICIVGVCSTIPDMGSKIMVECINGLAAILFISFFILSCNLGFGSCSSEATGSYFPESYSSVPKKEKKKDPYGLTPSPLPQPVAQSSRVETRSNNNNVQSPGIALAVQRGSMVFAYNDRSTVLFAIGAGDGLVGYTNRTVNIKRGNMVYTYNEKGSQTGMTSASY